MIRNCFNYVGSKDRIYPFIHKNLDHAKTILVDLFCGSGVIGVNESDHNTDVLLNDACWQLATTLTYFEQTEPSQVLSDIEKCVLEYELSKTNREGYNKLREYYNTSANLECENFDPVVFYCLITHSFNYNIHINSSGGFSVPFGANRSYLNNSLKKKLIIFQEYLYKNRSKNRVSQK